MFWQENWEVHLDFWKELGGITDKIILYTGEFKNL